MIFLEGGPRRQIDTSHSVEHPLVLGLHFGGYTPDNTLTNDEIASWGIMTASGKLLTAADIEKKTGVKLRHVANATETPLYMALRAIEDARVDPSSVDALFVATSHPTPENIATELRQQLKIPGEALAIHAACSGITRALLEIKLHEEQYLGKQIMLVATELYSPTVVHLKEDGAINRDPSLAQTLFTDGAEIMAGRYGIDFHILAAHGEKLPQEYTNYIRMQKKCEFVPPFIVEPVPEAEEFQQQGRDVYGVVRDLVPRLVRKVVAQAELEPDDIALIIPHQGSRHVVDALKHQLSDYPNKVYSDYADGNLSSGSVLRATKRASRQGSIHPGDNIALVQFGAGMYAAAAVVEFPKK